MSRPVPQGSSLALGWEAVGATTASLPRSSPTGEWPQRVNGPQDTYSHNTHPKHRPPSCAESIHGDSHQDRAWGLATWGPGNSTGAPPQTACQVSGAGVGSRQVRVSVDPPRAPGSLFFSPELLPRSLQRLRPQAAETRHGRPPVDRRRPALQASGGHRTPHGLGCPTKGALPGADTRPPGNRARSPQHPACWPAQGWGRHPGLRS